MQCHLSIFASVSWICWFIQTFLSHSTFTRHTSNGSSLLVSSFSFRSLIRFEFKKNDEIHHLVSYFQVIFNFYCIIYQRDCPFSNLCSWPLCQGFINCGPPVCPSGPWISFYANAVQSSLVPSCGISAGS